MEMGGVLIIDDDEAIRDSLALALEMEGYAVHTAADGREGLEFLRAIPRPALILLDLMMPKVDGESFLAELRASEPPGHHVPVVLVTAFAERARAVEGADGVLRKPVTVDALLEVAESYCRGG